MSIMLTPEQAAALARVASEQGSRLLQLHQVGEDPDLFVTTTGRGVPDRRICADGTVVTAPRSAA